MLKIFSYLLILLCINSCGFKPVYQRQPNSNLLYLESIQVMPINSQHGVAYYNHIKRLLPPTHKIKYRLITKINFVQDDAIIQRNSNISRKIVKIIVDYKIIDIKTDKLFTSGKFSRISSFSTNLTAYSSQLNQEDIYDRLAMMAAEEIRDRTILFIENHINKTRAIKKTAR